MIYAPSMEPGFEAVLRNQKKWGFTKGYQKLLREYEQYKKDKSSTIAEKKTQAQPGRFRIEIKREILDIEKNGTFSRGRVFGYILVVIFITAIVVMGRYEKKIKKERFDPVVKQLPTEPYIPIRFRFSIAKIEKNVLKANNLWTHYPTEKVELEEPEGFWQQYEDLLERVKNVGE